MGLRNRGELRRCPHKRLWKMDRWILHCRATQRYATNVTMPLRKASQVQRCTCPIEVRFSADVDLGWLETRERVFGVISQLSVYVLAMIDRRS